MSVDKLMNKERLNRLRRKAQWYVDISLLSDEHVGTQHYKPGLSLEANSCLAALHDYYIKEMGSDYEKYHKDGLVVKKK